MKRLLLITLTSLSIHVIAQTNIFPASGYVGIGTTVPTEVLETTGNIKANSGALISSISNVNIGGNLSLNNPTKTGNGQASMWRIYNMGGWYGNSLQFWAYDNVGCTSGGMCLPRFTILDNGNVGIGTTTPASKLDVRGDIYLNSGIEDNHIYWGGHNMTMGTPLGDYSHNVFTLKPGGSSNGSLFSIFQMFTAPSETQHELKVVIHTDGNSFFNGGNVGIGTTNPAYKLDVLGTIRAKEVLVNLDGGADFVFEKGYKLLPIEHVANYVQENKHLPDIPSANDMVKNGVSMGDMQVKLLQKVEELTLYAIQQNKKIQDQGEKLLEQEKKNKELEMELKSLKEVVTKNSTGGK